MLEYVRWVMVRKRDEAAPAPGDLVPRAADGASSRDARRRLPADRAGAYDFALAGSPHRFGDYQVGEKIDHVDGMTVEEAEHQIATRLYQNTARVHFNQFTAEQGPLRPPADLWRPRDFARARALVQRPRQCVPHRRRSMAGATSRRCSRAARCLRGRRCWPRPSLPDATMSARCACARSRPRTAVRDFPLRAGRRSAVILDLDYWVLMPR